MQDYKIRIPNQNIARQVQDKAIELGYSKNEYLYDNVTDVAALYVLWNRIGWSTELGMSGRFFEDYRQGTIEISYQDFLRLGEQTINNTIIEEIMSGEITLKCITVPQKAKNITVDRDYTGILIDSDDSQVDTLREATHFRCVNNNGIEAKYKLALFTTIAPPAPPRPQFPTWEQIESGIYVNDNNEVILDFNDEEYLIYDNEALEINTGTLCCGLNEIGGIQSLHNNIDRNCKFDLLEDRTNQQRLKDLVFKTLVNDSIEENSGAFRIFTLVSGHDAIDTLMQEVLTERGGVQTEYRRSTSSSNNIKVFVINL